ncbi:MAG: hypothetical protein WCD18_04575 [Thermosynechococcaceae cyanobacterium]
MESLSGEGLLVRVPFGAMGQSKGFYEDFLTGWLEPVAWGRPVGLAIAQDDALLISDEVGGIFWRVVYTGAV